MTSERTSDRVIYCWNKWIYLICYWHPWRILHIKCHTEIYKHPNRDIANALNNFAAVHIWLPYAKQLNSLRPNDAILRHRSGSALAQVMACCLTTPTHYLLLTDHQWSPMTITCGQFHKRYLSHQWVKLAWKLLINIFVQISQGPMS